MQALHFELVPPSPSTKRKSIRRRIKTGTVCQILGKSYSQVYRYVDAGVLNPINTLPAELRKEGGKNHTFEFYEDEVTKLATELGIRDSPDSP